SATWMVRLIGSRLGTSHATPMLNKYTFSLAPGSGPSNFTSPGLSFASNGSAAPSADGERHWSAFTPSISTGPVTAAYKPPSGRSKRGSGPISGGSQRRERATSEAARYPYE